MMKKWRNFILGIYCIIMALVTIPLLYKQIPGSTQMREIIEKENIDASALFYSEEEKTLTSKKEVDKKCRNVRGDQ